MRILQRLSRSWFAGLLVLMGQQSAVDAQALSALSSARAVHELTIAEAEAGRLVQITGVVTSLPNSDRVLTVQDGTHGAYVKLGEVIGELHLGCRVEVEGISGKVLYAPGVQQATVKAISEPATLPDAVPLAPEKFLTGRFAAGWVQLEGEVRSIVSKSGGFVLELKSGDARWRTHINGMMPADMERWLDATVRVSGVGFPVLNEVGHLTMMVMHSPGTNWMEMVNPADINPYERPLLSLANLGRYNPTDDGARRIHVRGTVSYCRPGHTIFIEDESGTGLIQTRQPGRLNPGDTIEAVGFREVTRGRVLVSGANFRVTGKSPAPIPLKMDVKTAWAGGFDGRLLRLQARVVETQQNGGEFQVVLQSGRKVFPANLAADGENHSLDVQPGELVEVTGIWLRQTDVGDNSQQYRLVLRDNADLLVVGAPPWWTVERLQIVGIVLCSGILLASLWVLVLRRRVLRLGRDMETQVQRQLAVQKQYRDLVVNARDFVFSVDKTGRFVAVNPAAESITGYRTEDLLRMRFCDLMADDQTDVVGALLMRPDLELPYSHQEIVCRSRDGRRLALEVNLQILRSEDNGVMVTTGVQGIARDVTERRRIESELQTSQQRLGLLVRESPLAVILWDADFCAREWNKSAERIFGYSAAEMIGQPASLIIPDKLRPHVSEVWSRLLTRQGGFRSTNENLTKAGGVIHCSWYNAPLLDSGGKVIGVASIVEDVTDRKLAEERLRRSERLYRSLVETSSDLIWSVDEQGCVTFVNESALRRIYGLAPEDILSHRFTQFVAPEFQRRDEDLFRRVMTGEALMQHESVHLRRDGRPIHLSINAIPVRDESGKVIGCTGTATDISRRRELEAQLRHSQKMDAVGQLAAGMAHDFNNLLTVVQGQAGLLMSRSNGNSDTLESLDEINAAAERGARLIRQLLAFSRKQSITQRHLDINEVVRNVTSMLHQLLGEDIALEFGLSHVPGSVLADPSLMEQVLVNLCVNARDAMPRGGRVAINTVLLKLEALTPDGNPDRRPGSFVCLSVSDTGTGMSSETLGHIFEPFFTTKAVGKGSGLGLSVVYGIVQQHRGWIEVESAPGQGTTFQIYLPHQPGRPEAHAVETTDRAMLPGKETILVVEDEQPVRELVCSILHDCGYKVLEAPNGPAALEIWKQHRDRVDLLLTDMVMPEGISGGELADRLVAEKPGLKVLCCSGYSAEFISRRFQSGKSASFLPKPYTPSLLSRKIREVLDGSPV